MLEAIKMLNIGLRFVLELCSLVIYGYWGFRTGSGITLKYVLGIGSPLLLAVVWGTFGSPKAPIKLVAPLHLLLEIAAFGLPALALYSVGKTNWAIAYAIVFVINEVLMLVWKQ